MWTIGAVGAVVAGREEFGAFYGAARAFGFGEDDATKRGCGGLAVVRHRQELASSREEFEAERNEASVVAVDAEGFAFACSGEAGRIENDEIEGVGVDEITGTGARVGLGAFEALDGASEVAEDIFANEGVMGGVEGVEAEVLFTAAKSAAGEVDASDAGGASQRSGDAEGTGVREEVEDAAARGGGLDASTVVALVEKESSGESVAELDFDLERAFAHREWAGRGVTAMCSSGCEFAVVGAAEVGAGAKFEVNAERAGSVDEIGEFIAAGDGFVGGEGESGVASVEVDFDAKKVVGGGVDPAKRFGAL